MNILDIIDKKRLKKELSYDEIKFAFMGYLNGEVESYQMYLLICIRPVQQVKKENS